MSTAPPNFEKQLTSYLGATERAKDASEASKAYLFLEFSRGVFKEINVDYLERLFPILEKHLTAKAKTIVVKGRADAFLGNLIIEFKKNLDKKSLEEAESELRRYISILWTNQKKDRISYIALATDGVNFVGYRPRTMTDGDELVPDDISLDPIDRMNLTKAKPGDAFVWLDRYMLTQTLKPATTEAFSGEFGLNKPAFREADTLLKQAWKENKETVVYDQWAGFLRIVYGSSVDSEDLFIRHTYLATVAKLLAYSSFSGGALPVSYEQIAEILEGRIFEKWNVHNFLEEDFFSWVGRNISGLKAASMLLERLATYDLLTIDEDILKSLYQDLVDPQARHDLGEYYTPDWLAEYIVKEVVEDPTKTILDPACGSGTFLAASVRRKKQLLSGKNPSEQLEVIINSVKGIDVHPLAVILSRTNFLTALGTDLLSARRGPISVPVYLADSIRLPDLDVDLFGGVRSFKIRAEGKILRLPLEVAEDPTLTDRVVEAVKDYARHLAIGEKSKLEDFENLLSQKIQSGKSKLSKNTPKVLLETAKTMAWLIKQNRDTVWAFILKNIYKPIFLKDRKFDILIGNPPWLSYRYVESTDYQIFLKKLILEEYNLLGSDRAELITQMELASLFLARTTDLYLANDGLLSFVMPRSLFVSDQHHNFRNCSYKPKMKIVEILDLEDVDPLFHVPSCVVTARKGTNHYPVNTVVFEGRLSAKNSKLIEAAKSLKQTKKIINYYQIGKRSFLEGPDFAKVLKAIEKGQRSQYYEKFTQGATIVPHSVWFVDTVVHPRLGIDPTKPRLRTSEKAIKGAKEQYKDVRMEGEVESKFLYQIATGSELAPFCTTTLQIAVLPIEPNGNSYHMLRAEEAQRKGYSGLRNWLKDAEVVWKSKRGEKAEKVDIYSWLNYSSKLTNQSPRAKYKVLYNKDGTYLVACLIENRYANLKAGSSIIPISGVCADDTTLHFDLDGLDEAMFLVAMLNAPIVDSLIKPMQSRGQWGERHIQKKVLELPLPRFDSKNRKHLELVELAKQARSKAEKIVPDLGSKYSSIGKIRQLVKIELSEEILKIDKIVRDLIVQTGSLPNNLEDYVKKS